MLKKIVTGVALVSTFGFVGSVVAQPVTGDGIKPSGVYVDANLGWGSSNFKKYFNSPSGISWKESGFVWNINVGYKFMPYFATDIGYWGFKKASCTGSSGGQSCNGDAQRQNIVVLAAKGILPLDDGFSIYGKLGPAWISFPHGSTSGGTYNSVSVYLGLGADYNFTESMSFGLLGSYIMKRSNCNFSANSCSGNPGYYALTANLGYIF